MALRTQAAPLTASRACESVTDARRGRVQMEEEGVPSTTLREISLLQMLSESNHIVK